MSTRAITFAGSAMEENCHVCAFFHSSEEEYRVLAPFIKEGLEHGERAFHIVDPDQQEQHADALKKTGVDVDRARGNKQLEIRRWQDAYLRDGHFDQDRMLALIQEVLDEGPKQGFPMTRLVAHMEWALEDRPGVNDLVEYETRLNYLLPKYRDPVICTYDLSKFSAGTVMDIMRTHPVVLVGGILQKNPFYVAPDELLLELRERDAYRHSASA